MSLSDVGGLDSSSIPVAKGLPLVGSALQYLNAPLRMFVDAYAKHGPIFRLQFPGQSVVVIAGKACAQFLKDNPVRGMHRRGLFDPFANEVGLDVFAEQGERNEHLRAAIKFPYAREIATQFVPEMVEITRDLAGSWCPGEEVDLFKVTAEMALTSAMAINSPIEMREELKAFSSAGNTVMYAIFNLRPRGVLKTPWYQAERNTMYKLVDEAIARHADGEFSRRAKLHLIDAALQATTPDGGKLDARSVRAAALFSLAGTEIYTGRLIGFMLFELLHNRDFLEKVLAEIDAAFQGPGLDAATFRRMPCLRAVWNETLRCYPLLPGYPYYTERTMNLLGYDVPENTYVLFVPYADHFSGEYYSNPLVFDPLRCLPPRRELARNGAFTPFGMGRKTCVAQGFSETIALTIACTLLREIDFRLVRPSYRMALAMAPLISPNENIPLRVVGKRKPAAREGARAALEIAPDFENLTSERTVVPVLHPEIHEAGAVVVRQGDPAEDFFIILDGSATVRKQAGDTVRDEGTLRSQNVFGEIGLLKGIPRTASVHAATTLTVIRIPKDKFIELVSDHDLSASDIGALIHMRYVQSVLHASLPHLEKSKKLKDFHWKHFDAGTVIFKQGDPSDTLYIIAGGSVKVSRMVAGRETDVISLDEGKFFGEMGIVTSSPRSATVVAEKDTTCLCAGRETLMEIVGNDANAMKDIALAIFTRVAANVKKSDKKDS